MYRRAYTFIPNFFHERLLHMITLEMAVLKRLLFISNLHSDSNYFDFCTWHLFIKYFKQFLSYKHWLFLKNRTLPPTHIFKLKFTTSNLVIQLHHLNRALYLSFTCRSLCNSNKQMGWTCVSNHSGKPCNLKGRTASSQSEPW